MDFLRHSLYLPGAIVVLGIGLALIVAFVVGWWWDRSKGRARCPSCWYMMDGIALPGRCPECGRTITRSRELYRCRRQRMLVRLSIPAMLVLIYVAPIVGMYWTDVAWPFSTTTVVWIARHAPLIRSGALYSLQQRMRQGRLTKIEEFAEIARDDLRFPLSTGLTLPKTWVKGRPLPVRVDPAYLGHQFFGTDSYWKSTRSIRIRPHYSSESIAGELRSWELQMWRGREYEAGDHGSDCVMFLPAPSTDLKHVTLDVEVLEHFFRRGDEGVVIARETLTAPVAFMETLDDLLPAAPESVCTYIRSRLSFSDGAGRVKGVSMDLTPDAQTAGVSVGLRVLLYADGQLIATTRGRFSEVKDPPGLHLSRPWNFTDAYNQFAEYKAFEVVVEGDQDFAASGILDGATSYWKGSFKINPAPFVTDLRR